MFHFIGDLHQPLHASTNYQYVHSGDQGGNLFKIVYDSSIDNLHSLWDACFNEVPNNYSASIPPISDLYYDTLTRYTKMIIELHPYASLEEQAVMIDWDKVLEESHSLAEDVVYDGIGQNEIPSSSYLFRGRKVCVK